MPSGTRPRSSSCWTPTDLDASAAGHRDQGRGVRDCRAAGVVVEEDVRTAESSRPPEPAGEGRPAAAGPGVRAPLVHPDIPEIPGLPEGSERTTLSIRPAQHRPVFL